MMNYTTESWQNQKFNCSIVPNHQTLLSFSCF